MKRTVACVSLLLLSKLAFASESGFSSLVKSIYPQGDGSVILTFETGTSACTNGSSPKFFLVANGYNGVTADGVKNIYGAAILAMALNRPLTVAFENSSSLCPINRVFIENDD